MHNSLRTENRQMMTHDDNELTYLLQGEKRKHHLSAQIAHNKSNITYYLQGEKKAPFVSPDLTQQIQDHLQPAR
jgi:hypothetical protein